MSGFQVDPAIVRQQANYEFFVANWPQRLQEASRLERELLGLMAHPCYRLLVRRGDDGADELIVRKSPEMPSPLTPAARRHIEAHRAQIIAFVRQRDRTTGHVREVMQ